MDRHHAIVSNLLDTAEPSVDALEVAIGAWLGEIGGCPPLAFDDISGNWLGRNNVRIDTTEMACFRAFAEKVLTRIYPDELHATLINMFLGVEHVGLRVSQSTISPATARILYHANKLYIRSTLWYNLSIRACHAVISSILIHGSWCAAPPPSLQLDILAPLENFGERSGVDLVDGKEYLTLLASSMYVIYFMAYVEVVVSHASKYSDEWIAIVFSLVMSYHVSGGANYRARRNLGMRYGTFIGDQWPRFYQWIDPMRAITHAKLDPPDLDEIGDWQLRRCTQNTWMIANNNSFLMAIVNKDLWQRRIALQHARRNFALMVLVGDGFLRTRQGSGQRAAVATRLQRTARFFNIATKLPTDVQQVLAWRMLGRGNTTVPTLTNVLLLWALEARI